MKRTLHLKGALTLVTNNYLHDGGRAGGSLPQQEVDVQGLEELLVVLGADTLILSDDRHLERRSSVKSFGREG